MLFLFTILWVLDMCNASVRDFKVLEDVVRSKNILRLKKLISEGSIDFHSRSPEGHSILHVGARIGNHDILRILLEVIANPGPVDVLGKTPLHTAAAAGHKQAVVILLENGAHVDAKDVWGRTPLHDAAEKNRIGVVQSLIERGAGVDATDGVGNAPLHLASCSASADMIRILLDAGADARKRNGIGRTPLAVSVVCGRRRLYTVLSSLPHPPNFKDAFGNTLRDLAIIGNSPEILKRIKATSQPSFSEEHFNHSPLSDTQYGKGISSADNLTQSSTYSTISPNNELSEKPITSQALNKFDLQDDPLQDESNPETSLINPTRLQEVLFYNAILHNDIESIERMLDSGYTFGIKNAYNKTPAEYAISNCRVEVLEVFLANGLNANETDKIYEPLIHQAIATSNHSIESDKLINGTRFECSLKLVNALLRYGADVCAVNANGWTALHLTVEFNNLNVAKLLISSGANIDQRDVNGKTPLFLAVELNRFEIFSYLISLNASVHLREGSRLYYPIHIAARDGRIGMLSKLLEKGADIEQKCSWYERRPLHEATVSNRTEAVRYLLSQGADVDAADSWDRTSLHLAAQCGFIQIGLLLIASNATIESVMRESRTPLMVATSLGKHAFAELLLEKGANFRHRSQDGRTILHWASISGSLRLVKRYVEEFAELINDLDNAGKSPLFWASLDGNVEIFRLLADHGADPFVKSDVNMTILHAAAESGNYDTVKECLQYEIDIDAVDKNGRTALSMAAKSGHICVVSLLLSFGADPLVRSKLNETLLHWAAFSGNLEVTEAVINITKEINPQDSEGITPMYRAAINGRYNVFEVLLDNGGDPTIPRNNGDTIMHWAAHYGDVRVMNRLLSKSQNLEFRDRNGRTPLYVSAEKGRFGTFDLLVSKGAKLNVISSESRSIVHAATIGRNLNILKFVLNKSCDINAEDNMGRTPLFIAASLPSIGVFDCLLKNGADLSAETLDGRTVLHAAAFGGDINICDRILRQSNMINLRDELGKSALYYTVERKKRSAFNFLLRLGSDTEPAKGGWTLLHSAAKGGDVIILNTVLNLSGDIDARDDQGQTPLFVSVSNSNTIIFQLLLGRKANPDIPNNTGYTVLHWASHYGDRDTAERILAVSNESVNAEDIGRKTPLHWAVYYGHIGLTALLLRYGADPEGENSFGYTPVMIAAARGSVAMMEIFSPVSYNGEAMLGIALAWGNREVLNYFLSSRVRPSEKNILHFAAARGDDAQLTQLFRANVNSRRERFYDITKEITKEYSRFTVSMDADDVYIINPVQFKLSPLEMAILFNGSVDTVKLILELSNTSLLELNNSRRRWSPLDMAAFCGKDALVSYLIELGVSVNMRSADSWTCVHKAAWGGHGSTLHLLHRHGADLDLSDSLGRTPLHIAAMRGFVDTVQQILNLSKRSINTKDRYYFTPLHLSEIFGHQRYFDYLALGTITLDATLRYGIKDPGLVTSSLRNHTRTITALLESGADPNSQDRVFGWTVLHWSAAIGHLEVASLLLEHGACVNVPSNIEQTPMYLSRYWGRTQIYNLLREKNGVW